MRSICLVHDARPSMARQNVFCLGGSRSADIQMSASCSPRVRRRSCSSRTSGTAGARQACLSFPSRTDFFGFLPPDKFRQNDMNSIQQIVDQELWQNREIVARVDMAAEKRSVPRRRVLKAGTIEFGGSAIDCTVRNLSRVGAALDVMTPVGIPHEFVLIVPSDEMRFTCRVVWRKPARIGVSFE